MLSFFRRGGAGQIVIGVIVFAIILVFVVEFRAGGGKRGCSFRVECAARVYGKCIGRKDFDAALRLIAGRLEAKQQRELKIAQVVVEGLVERELLLKEARRLGIGIGEDEIDDELEAGRAHVSLPVESLERLAPPLMLCSLVPHPLIPDPARAAQNAICAEGSPRGVRLIPVKNSKTQRFDYDIYERNIRVHTNRSPKEFKKMQRHELVAERVRELIRSQVVVSEAETYAAYARDNTKVVARTAKLKRDWFLKYVVQVSDVVVGDWLADNEDQVKERWDHVKDQWKADCPLVSEIRVRFPTAATDEDKRLVRGKIDAALERLEDGESFADVAREVSDGLSAVTGGAIGCFSPESYGPGGQMLADALVTLDIGDTTGVVEAPEGFYVMRLDGKLAQADLETVGKHHLARDLAMRFKADGEMKKFADELLGELKEGKDLEEITKRLTRKYLAVAQGKDPEAAEDGDLRGFDSSDRPRADVTAPFTRYAAPFVSANPLDNPGVAAFALEKAGSVHPQPIETGDGVMVLQLKERIEVEREDFNKEKLTLMRRRQRVKAQEALVDYVEALRTAAEGQIEINMDLIAPAPEEGEEPAPPDEQE
jgi:parvulin-like peptidyl-prolyl isomerase